MNCDECRKPLGAVRIRIGNRRYHEGCLGESERPSKRRKLELIPGNPNSSEVKKVPAITGIVELLLEMTLDRIKDPNFKPRLKTIKLAQEILDRISGKRL